MTTNTTEFILEMDTSTEPVDQPIEHSPPRDISSLLRTFGAIAVIASLSLFLIEGWTEGNDLTRYFKLLAQTGLITGAGIFLSTVVKEAKGARVFFGLGLIAAVANFTILGALVYSVIPFDSAQGDYSSALKWQAVSMAKLIPLGIGTFAIMGLLAKFSFAIFARNASAKLTALFTILCALLLVPVREPMLVAPLAAIALFFAIRTAIGLLQRDDFTPTAEAKFALATLFIPGGIIVCRSLGLYAVDELVILTFCAATYYAIRSAYPLIERKSTKLISLFVQFAASFGAAVSLGSLAESFSDAAMLLIWSSTMLLATFDLIKQRSHSDGADNLNALVILSGLAITVVNTLCSLASSALDIQLVCFFNLVGLIVLSNIVESSNIKVAATRVVAIIGLMLCSFSLIADIIAALNVGAWALVGVGGVSLILVGSLYERYGQQLKLSLRSKSPQT